MNTSAAEAIAMKIREVWGATGPTVSAWVAELEPLNEDTARSALNDLKMTLDRCPSIARLHATYREHRKSGDHRPPCLGCDGAGWVQAHGFQANGTAYSAVDRCKVCEGSGKASAPALGGSR